STTSQISPREVARETTQPAASSELEAKKSRKTAPQKMKKGKCLQAPAPAPMDFGPCTLDFRLWHSVPQHRGNHLIQRLVASADRIKNGVAHRLVVVLGQLGEDLLPLLIRIAPVLQPRFDGCVIALVIGHGEFPRG